MIKRADRRSTLWLLQAVIRLFPCIAAAVVLVVAVRSSPATGQVESRCPGDRAGRVNVVAADGPTPTPLPCPSCWFTYSARQDFDAVTPPALPPDWLATNAQGPPPLWVSSNSGVPMPPADTAPNALFVDDPSVISDKRVDGQLIGFFESCCVRLTFRHNFNLEASDVDPNLGFDGGVLELSTDGGNTFQDITAAGGSFVIGGYNRTIAIDRGSPIAGRQAWSGSSGGYITTVVNVPNFQTLGRLRWRMASDNSGSNEGWRVDTLNITWCNGMGTPCPTPTPARRSTPSPRVRPTPVPRPSS
jgi:hypothetical protein